MKYGRIVPGEFIARPNRFVAQVIIDGKEVPVHVKNTGRCRELLLPGSRVYLEDHSQNHGKRKLMYDLVAVEKGNLLINMDSQAPNKAVGEALESGILQIPGMCRQQLIRAERVFGDSRFDFFIRDEKGREAFAEVKGVTLENDGVATFPDAPTERGIKHLAGLVKAVEQGYAACVIFVIQMEGMRFFTPNEQRHAAFARALRDASASGVSVIARECRVTPGSMEIAGEIPVLL